MTERPGPHEDERDEPPEPLPDPDADPHVWDADEDIAEATRLAGDDDKKDQF